MSKLWRRVYWLLPKKRRGEIRTGEELVDLIEQCGLMWGCLVRVQCAFSLKIKQVIWIADLSGLLLELIVKAIKSRCCWNLHQGPKDRLNSYLTWLTERMNGWLTWLLPDYLINRLTQTNTEYSGHSVLKTHFLLTFSHHEQGLCWILYVSADLFSVFTHCKPVAKARTCVHRNSKMLN